MNEIWGVLAAVLSSAIGGTSIGATRFLVDAMDPLAIGSFRFGLGILMLLPLALAQRTRWPARQDWPAVAGLGLLFFAVFPVLFNASLIFTTAARGSGCLWWRDDILSLVIRAGACHANSRRDLRHR